MKSYTITLLIAIFLIAGCNKQELTFQVGISELQNIDEEFGTTLKSPPDSIEEIDHLQSQIIGLRDEYELSAPLESFVDFRISLLEAEKLNAEGWQWGRASTTEYGFGCIKGYERIKESALLRNKSADYGYQAALLLEEFIESHPQESKMLNLTMKDVLILKAEYFKAQEKANMDYKIVESLCNKGEINATD
jgi:hypothetical protein